MLCLIRVKLRHFSKFADMTDALSAATAAVEGKMNKELKKVLKKVFSSEVQEQLAVADAKLGNVIKVRSVRSEELWSMWVWPYNANSKVVLISE